MVRNKDVYDTRGPYQHELAPAVRRGDLIELEPLGEFYTVRRVGLIPSIVVEVDVTANGTAANQKIDSLEMHSNMLAQYRIPEADAIRDGVEVKVAQDGRESPMFRTKQEQAGWISDTPAHSFESNLTEIYQWEDRDLHFTTIDESNDGTPLEIPFVGFQYVLDEVDGPAKPEESIGLPVAPIGPDR